jgi:hypothetical protein
MVENIIDICATLPVQVPYLTFAGRSTALSEDRHRYFGIGLGTYTHKTMKIIASRGQEIKLNVGSEQR